MGFFVAWLLRMTDAARLCHSERSEESRASDHPALRSIDPGLSDSMYRLCVSFVRVYTQQSRSGLGFFVAWLLRMTDAARPSVILNAVKNPEPPTTQRSGLSTHDSLIPCTDCESRLSGCKRGSRALPGILRRLAPQNDRRRSPWPPPRIGVRGKPAQARPSPPLNNWRIWPNSNKC